MKEKGEISPDISNISPINFFDTARLTYVTESM